MAIVLLACLIVYVINVGVQARTRVNAQHAADAAAINGAAWVARSLNTVAMNNVAISRYLALVNVVDALPITTTNSINEAGVIDAGVSRALTASTGTPALDSLVTQELNLLLSEMHEENAMLANLSGALQQFDVEGMTHFVTPSGERGKFWQAMKSLDEMSQAAVESVGEVATAGAGDAAVNLGGGTATSVTTNGSAYNVASSGTTTTATSGNRTLLLPANPTIPWARGTFADFQRPVLQGLLPVTVDDKQYNRGPYDTIYGWREPNLIWVPDPPGSGGGGPPPPPPIIHVGGVDTGGAPSPFGGGPGNSVQYPVSPPNGHFESTGYHTYGTFHWTLSQITSFASQPGRPSLNKVRFSHWLGMLSRAKLDYAWAGLSPRFFAQVSWDANYPTDVPQLASQPLPFSETLSLRLDIRSRYPRGHPDFLTPGSWAFQGERYAPNTSMVHVNRAGGWWLPNLQGTSPPQRMTNPLQVVPPPGGSIQQLGPGPAWLYEYPYMVGQDDQIGVPPASNALGQPVAQQVYFIQLAWFVGVNRNPRGPQLYPDARSALDIEVSNPTQGLDPIEAPAPVDLNHDQLPHNSTVARRQYLTFLGLARAANKPAVLPDRFKVRRPAPEIVTIAQAKVFNDHSWDLWTQMWHAQLEPVSDFPGWVDVLSTAAGGSGPNATPADPELADLRDYLKSLEQLAPVMLRH